MHFLAPRSRAFAMPSFVRGTGIHFEERWTMLSFILQASGSRNVDPDLQDVPRRSESGTS